MAWLEIDRTSKMEHSYYVSGVLYLGWLVSSDYATVYLITFYHAHLRWVLCSRCVTYNYFGIIIIVIIISIFVISSWILFKAFYVFRHFLSTNSIPGCKCFLLVLLPINYFCSRFILNCKFV